MTTEELTLLTTEERVTYVEGRKERLVMGTFLIVAAPVLFSLMYLLTH